VTAGDGQCLAADQGQDGEDAVEAFGGPVLVPFVVLFPGYKALRGIAPKAGFSRHYGFVIRLDKVMFGGVVPSQWLQAHLGSLRWLAVACTVTYFCHFVIPVGVGMVLWLVDRVQFLRYTVALLRMSFAGFVVFLILPVAPPWLAGLHDLRGQPGPAAGGAGAGRTGRAGLQPRDQPALRLHRPARCRRRRTGCRWRSRPGEDPVRARLTTTGSQRHANPQRGTAGGEPSLGALD
jgi:PAP2 superfamily